MSDVYALRNNLLKRFRDGQTFSPGNNPVAAARFPGDPGRGRVLVGQNHLDGATIAQVEAGTKKGLSITEFEKAIFPDSAGYTDATRPRMSFVREYVAETQLFTIPSDYMTKIDGWGAEGRICNLSIQSASEDPTWNMVSICNALDSLSDNATKQRVRSWCTWWKSCGYPVWFLINHEPQTSSKVTLAQAYYQRKGSRLLYAYIKAQGVNNVAFIGPHPVGNDYKSNNNWQDFHPEWIDDNNGWTADQVLDCDGWDPYNPSLKSGLPRDANGEQNFPIDARTMQWSTDKFREYKDRVNRYTADGYHHKPLCVGEIGVYGQQPSLWSAQDGADGQEGGITFPVFYNNVGDTCYETNTVALGHFGTGYGNFTNDGDPYGVKRAGLRGAITRANSKFVMARL
jgi:hypothetical protein